MKYLRLALLAVSFALPIYGSADYSTLSPSAITVIEKKNPQKKTLFSKLKIAVSNLWLGIKKLFLESTDELIRLLIIALIVAIVISIVIWFLPWPLDVLLATLALIVALIFLLRML